MVKFNNVSISYNSNVILKNISFEIIHGDKVLICGKSGIGKSSILKAILGFIDFSGKINIGDLDVNSKNIERIRQLISYMPQEINMPINSIKEFLNFTSTWNSSQKGTKKKMLELLKKFRIENELQEKQLSEISGGQKQRIVFASCVAQDKPFLLLDEPDSSMDIENKRIIREYLMGLENTVVLISHDLDWSKYVNKTINLDSNGQNN